MEIGVSFPSSQESDLKDFERYSVQTQASFLVIMKNGFLVERRRQAMQKRGMQEATKYVDLQDVRSNCGLNSPLAQGADSGDAMVYRAV